MIKANGKLITQKEALGGWYEELTTNDRLQNEEISYKDLFGKYQSIYKVVMNSSLGDSDKTIQERLFDDYSIEVMDVWAIFANSYQDALNKDKGEGASFETYLRMKFKSDLVDEIRKLQAKPQNDSSRKPKLEDDETGISYNLDPIFINDKSIACEDSMLVADILDHVVNNYRPILATMYKLRIIEGNTFSDIAKELRLSERTVYRVWDDLQYFLRRDFKDILRG